MLVHVPYSMPILRARQPRGGEVLQCLRRRIAPSTAPCIVRALRDGESRSSDRLLLVPRPVAGAQRRARSRLALRRSLHVFASPALSSDRRNSGSRGAAVVGSALIVAGYYSYRQRSLADAPQPPAAS